MSPRQVQKTKTVEEEAPEVQPADEASSSDKLKAELDALLDEIDEVLEENEAADFVKSFVQKGGE